MDDFFMGGIIQFGGNFAPKDFAFCHGQLMSISENQALYAILGTTYGGDGRTNYAVPDLRGRAPIGSGRGPGITEYRLAQMTGLNDIKLQVPHLPAHSHTATFTGTGGTGSTGGGGEATVTMKVALAATTTEGNLAIPKEGAYLAQTKPPKGGKDEPEFIYSDNPGDTVNLGGVTATGTVPMTGGGITGGTVAIGSTGGNAAFPIMQPSICMNYIIALQGLFPSRN